MIIRLLVMIFSLLGFNGCKWDSSEAISKVIKTCSSKYDLDEKLIAAIIYQESRGDTHAYRYEPAFYKKYIEKLKRNELPGYVPVGIPTLASEKRFRSTSFGCMQLMGNTARLNGFKGRYLTQLSDPEINIDIGCRYLKKLISKKNGDIHKALLAYNGGGNKNYPLEVLNHIENEAYKQVLLEI